MPTVELAQGSIHYTDEGRGPVVVLLHGAFVSARLWRKVVPILRADHRVVVPELPLGAHRRPMPAAADVSPLGVARLVADLLDDRGEQRLLAAGEVVVQRAARHAGDADDLLGADRRVAALGEQAARREHQRATRHRGALGVAVRRLL